MIAFAIAEELTEQQIVEHVDLILADLAKMPTPFQVGVSLLEADFSTCKIHATDNEQKAIPTQASGSFECQIPVYETADFDIKNISQ